MGKKKSDKITAIVPSQSLTQISGIDIPNIVAKTEEQIQAGLKKTTASTGTPIENLHGAAKIMAQLSNIGNGSVSSGGGGIKAGFNTIAVNIKAKAYLSGYVQQLSQHSYTAVTGADCR